MNSYTYIIENTSLGLWYIGSRSANVGLGVEPKNDTSYMGSSKYLKSLMKTYPDGWKKRVITEHSTPSEAADTEVFMLEFFWNTPGRINKARGKMIDYTDEQVIAAYRKSRKKLMDDPSWRDAQSSRIKNAMLTDKWKQGHAKGVEKRSANPEWKNVLAETGRKNSANKDRSAKLSASAQTRKHLYIKPVIATNLDTGSEFTINGGHTEMTALGFTPSGVVECCKGRRAKHKGHTFRYA